MDDDFLRECQRIVGMGHVGSASDASLTHAANSLGSFRAAMRGFVKPGSVAEVSAIVEAAFAYGAALYPISLGNNWGFGGKMPSSKNCVILDLSRMNKILEFDPATGTITVEPGVTMGDVEAFLEEKNSRFIAPTNGSGPFSSLVGNALEKGSSASPPYERALSVVSLEAILPNGSLYSSKSEKRGADPATPYPLGLGPHLDALFAQNGIGIVVQMTFLLVPQPTSARVFFFKGEKLHDITTGLKALHELGQKFPGILASYKMEGPLRSIWQFLPYKTLWPHKDRTAPPELVAAQLKAHALGPINFFGILHGEPEVLRVSQKSIGRRLRSQGFKPLFYERSQLHLTREALVMFPARIRNHHAHLKLAADYIERSVGVSMKINSWLPGWRYSDLIDLQDSQNAAIDTQGVYGYLLFLAAFSPAARLDEFVRQTENACIAENIEPIYTIASMPGNYMRFALHISFDKKDPVHEKQAHECYRKIFDLALEHNALPYRIPVSMPDLLLQARPHVWGLAKKIKMGVDPANIIAPGRYAPEL